MPPKKSIKDVTFKELEEILKTLQAKFLEDREHFESFLPELVPLLEKIYGGRVKTERSRAKKAGSIQRETPNFQEKRFTLIDEFLTERERKTRYERALSILHKFKETGLLSSDEMKRFVVNAALSNFKNRAQPEDLPSALPDNANPASNLCVGPCTCLPSRASGRFPGNGSITTPREARAKPIMKLCGL